MKSSAACSHDSRPLWHCRWFIDADFGGAASAQPNKGHHGPNGKLSLLIQPNSILTVSGPLLPEVTSPVVETITIMCDPLSFHCRYKLM